MDSGLTDRGLSTDACGEADKRLDAARLPRPSEPVLLGTSVPEWFLAVSMMIGGIVAYLSVEATYPVHKSVLLGVKYPWRRCQIMCAIQFYQTDGLTEEAVYLERHFSRLAS